jgi:uncharacterized protein (TIGR02996 family)
MARKRATAEEALAGPQMTDAERAELDARLAGMISKPQKSDLGDGRFFLLWVQRDENDSAQVMVWHPETPEELRGANFFHDAAHGLGEFAKPVKKGKAFKRTAEHDAFIKAILANRDDDTGYLAYADFLSERGDSQGDLIRLCVEIDKLSPESAEAEEKNQRLNELMDAHAEEWYAPLGDLGLRPEFFGDFTPWLWLSLEHGVIEEVTIDRPGVLPQNAARLFAAAPFLRKLEFERGHLDPAGLAKVKQLAQIDHLALGHTDLNDAGLRVLLRSKHLTNLKTLELGGDPIGDAGAAALAAWAGLAKLETLDVSGCDIQADGLRALLESGKLANLTRLMVGRNPFGDDGVNLLSDCRGLTKLRELDLASLEFFPIATSSLDLASFAKTLESLDLDGANFQPGAFEALTRCKFPALKRLKLNSVALRAPEAELLASATWRKTLSELYLDVCAFGPAGLEALVRGDFPRLTKLDLSRNALGTRGGAALAKAAKNFPALTSLRLWDNKLTPAAVEALAKSKLLANVTELDLNGNNIGPAGATALAKSKHLGKLTSLIVDEKPVGKKGKQALLDRFGEGVVSFR